MSDKPFSTVEGSARDVVAGLTGLPAAVVERVVREYRATVAELHDEPQWTAQTHISFGSSAIALYVADGTRVALQQESHKVRGDWQQFPNIYVLDSKVYETFAEARTAELSAERKATEGDVVALGPRP